VTIVNQLGTVLAAACEHASERGWTRRERRGVTVFAPAFTVRRLVEDGFAGLVRFSKDHPRVLARIIEVLREVSSRQPEGEARLAILEVAGWVEHVTAHADLAPHERRLLALRLADFHGLRSRGPAERPHAMH
jgi:hypothetical protein